LLRSSLSQLVADKSKKEMARYPAQRQINTEQVMASAYLCNTLKETCNADLSNRWLSSEAVRFFENRAIVMPAIQGVSWRDHL
jgi:hypothetical protein